MTSSTQPRVTGTPLENYIDDPKDIYLLGVKDPESPLARKLYALDKETIFQGVFQDLDISEAIFNNPKYKTSYQDIIPNTWKSLPDLKKISLDYSLDWIVEYKRNPDIKGTLNGVQTVSTFTGITFIRYGIDGVWTKWQLHSNNVIGSLLNMIVPKKYEYLNRIGWIPLIGTTYSKQMYPELYLLVKDIFKTDDDTFTLPDTRGTYTKSYDGKSNDIGSVKKWTLPDFSDEIDFVKGSYYNKSLFKEMTNVDKLFTVSDKDDSTTTISYLNNDSIININNGEPVEGDSSGLTSVLKLDLINRFKKEHVSTEINPNYFVSSALYIYAGYPQI